MTVKIFHNPKCSKSRQTLGLIETSNQEVEVIEYLKVGWKKEELKKLFAEAGIRPRDALRAKAQPAEELGLYYPETSDETVLDAMVKHPALVERPIVQSPKGVRICRPPERVHELL